MARTVLVMGGTRYFGKRLVRMLIERGDAVTLANRGKTQDDFGDSVRRETLDRTDADSLHKLAQSGTWDLVIDNICYAPDEALEACFAFRGRVGRWIHTSTQSVYAKNGEQRETDFDPAKHKVELARRDEVDYAEGKRLAEAVYAQRSLFPVTMMRIPIVLGEDDYTGRLKFHVERVRDGKAIGASRPEAKTSFISSQDAARALLWLSEHPEVKGAINVASPDALSLNEILAMIAAAAGRAPVLSMMGERAEGGGSIASAEPTPFFVTEPGKDPTRVLNLERAHAAGLKLTPIAEWLPAAIRAYL